MKETRPVNAVLNIRLEKDFCLRENVQIIKNVELFLSTEF